VLLACAGFISKPSASATATPPGTMPAAPQPWRRSSPGPLNRRWRKLTGRGDWDGALKLVEAQKSTRQIERDAANRRRAVLLTAKAQALIDSDPNAARTAAAEANKLVPDFAPAAVVAANLLFKQNDVRKGSKILETAWRAEPHPEIAELYTHARPGDAVVDRLNRQRSCRS